MLNDLFIPEDAVRILKTPVNREREDEWYWRYEFRGCYSVVSKIRNLLWRSIKEVLPVCATLRKRRIDVEAVCPLCNNVEEMPLPPQVNQTDYGW
nr:uncharacterized protein LOC109180209 [Ipomoea batatas]